MDGFVSDPDFLDLLRVIQLSLIRGELKPEDVTGNGRKNRASNIPRAIRK